MRLFKTKLAKSFTGYGFEGGVATQREGGLALGEGISKVVYFTFIFLKIAFTIHNFFQYRYEKYFKMN